MWYLDVYLYHILMERKKYAWKNQEWIYLTIILLFYFLLYLTHFSNISREHETHVLNKARGISNTCLLISIILS